MDIAVEYRASKKKKLNQKLKKSEKCKTETANQIQVMWIIESEWAL